MNFDPANLPLFVAVVRAGSFSAASEQLGVPASTTSRRIAQLERSLGVRLLHRTTRSLRPTDAGQVYFDRAVAIVDAMEQANRAVTRARQEVTGRLRITAPYGLGERRVYDWVMAFQAVHPQVAIELQLDNHLVNLPASGIDLAFRAAPLEDSSLVARHLFDSRWRTVVHPDRVKKGGVPAHPEDLARMPAVVSSVDAAPIVWEYRRGGETVRVRPDTRLRFNDLRLAQRAALAGHGVALLPEMVVADALQRDELVELLPDWEGPTTGVHLLYHGRTLLTLAQQAFIDFVLKQCDRGLVQEC